MIQIKCRYTQKVLWEGEAESVMNAVVKAVKERAYLSGADLRRADLRDANLSDANLSGANLSGANLSGADLSDANLSDIKEDYFKKLALQPKEVSGLYKAIIDGLINGSTYSGDCACFVGTIANVAHVNYKFLPNLKPDSSSLTEKWYLAIKKGDTPENSSVSKITAEWTEEFMRENGIAVPTRKVIWSDGGESE